MVYLIYGSPCSGKSTYIKTHKKSNDLICDVDTIYSAISGNNEHNTELYTHEVACRLYDVLKDIIYNRQGNWKNAYVVSIANTKEKVQELKKEIKAD